MNNYCRQIPKDNFALVIIKPDAIRRGPTAFHMLSEIAACWRLIKTKVIRLSNDEIKQLVGDKPLDYFNAWGTTFGFAILLYGAVKPELEALHQRFIEQYRDPTKDPNTHDLLLYKIGDELDAALPIVFPEDAVNASDHKLAA